MGFLENLKLQNFRCYAHANLHDLSHGLIVLSGPNGAGKTNILEAISLLSPGRGLRGAKIIDIQNKIAPEPWAIAAHVKTAYETVTLGTGLDVKNTGSTEKRTVRINHKTERSQNAFASYLSCVWLTPQMDRLFLDSSRERRKFLDRLVFAFDPAHAGRVTRYENALSQRSKILRDQIGEPAWLDALESQITQSGIAIAAARLAFIHKLDQACDKMDYTHFPRARFTVQGTIETLLENAPALEAEDAFRYQLKTGRSRDAVTGGAASGPHKSDLHVVYASKNMPADQCSTGEQKALLIGLILAHARLIKSERGNPPIILLDEVAAHLDENRRAALYEILGDMRAQCWMTGTESTLFDAARHNAQFFTIENAHIHINNRAAA